MGNTFGYEATFIGLLILAVLAIAYVTVVVLYRLFKTQN
ncbi:hypothetical protein BJY26_000340 [Spelaeicoccus albus]|uniref:Uncharacterized protein n=1 Tax=Spelaeicoccus albus TaxID=1280376 RepID=A0A7Z0A7U4_9MICO|nr:hypothetical protein [Spelaeicoccus albus]